MIQACILSTAMAASWSLCAKDTLITDAELPTTVRTQPTSIQVTTAGHETRTVALTITVTDAKGMPIARASVAAFSLRHRVFAHSDGNGLCQLQVPVEPNESRIAVQISMPGLDKPEAQVLGLINKVYWVDVASGALAAHLAIALEPVKIVSGRFLTVDGKPLKGTVAIQSALNRSRVGLDGRFRIPVPENRAEYVYFVAHGYPVKSLHVDPLAEDRDFGDIEVSERNGDSVVSITLSQADQTDHRIDNKGSGVSLVSVNGNTVLTFVAKETSKGTQVFANTGTEDMPHVPEGTYYATPGLFGNSLSYLVLDAVRAGRTDELDKAGVPKIVAVPGKVSELTINVPQADVAISALPERGSTGSKPAAPKAPK